MADFINLFCYPALPLYLYCKRYGKPMKAGMELLIQYAVFTAGNLVVTRIFTGFVSRVFSVHVGMGSGYFSLAAAVAAVLISVLSPIIKCCYVDVEKIGSEKK